MLKSEIHITKMDCPSEENLIRMKLEGYEGIQKLEFDIPNRTLTIVHTGEIDSIFSTITELNLGSKIISTEETDNIETSEDNNQRKLLWAVLLINFSFFIIEMSTGIISLSMGLVADSLDMLADSFVYAISLFAVGSGIKRKKKIATIAGYFQSALAVLGLIEVIRRFVDFTNVPDFSTMIIVSFLALIGNAVCLYLLQKSKSKDAHMQASMIFTSNDVIINLGVITAGILVNILSSNLPDLIIGIIVFILVIRGAVRILQLGK